MKLQKNKKIESRQLSPQGQNIRSEQGREQQPIPSVEKTPQKEQITEQPAEPQQQAQTQQQVPATQQQPEPTEKNEQIQKIEEILSEDLAEIYKEMSPEVKQEFKTKGEEVTATIRTWIVEAKVVAKNVLELIRDWLNIIPNVNKHYLNQESKIKTDQIMELARKQ